MAKKKYVSQVDRETIKSNLSEKAVEGLMEEVDSWVSTFNIIEMRNFIKQIEDFHNKAMKPVNEFEAGVTIQSLAHEATPLFVTGYYLIEQLRNKYVAKKDRITMTFASMQQVGTTGPRLVIRKDVPIKEVLTSIGVYMGGKRNELKEIDEVTSIIARFTKRPNLKNGSYQSKELTVLFQNIIKVSKRKGVSHLNGGWAFEVYQQILHNESLRGLQKDPNAILNKNDPRYHMVIEIINNARKNTLLFYKGPDDNSSMAQLKMWNFTAPSLAHLQTIYRCLKVFIALFDAAQSYAKKTGKKTENQLIRTLFTTKTLDETMDGVDDLLASIVEEHLAELDFNALEKIFTIK